MKKEYKKPAVTQAHIESVNPLANSGVWSDKMGYGGVDDGTHAPSSRWHNRLWDDDDDDWLLED
ncbi:MAG: hypothetical protein IJT98_09175 [Prevotella sp.]|nr:hypothetical protein [Prevotella sp.]